MSEKRFRANFDVSIYDSEKEEYISVRERGLEEIAKIMNEQQATNDYLEESNSRLQVQLGETLRLVDKLKEENEQLRQQLQDWDDMVELATKTSLRNVELNEQIGQLRKELNDCEKFRYTVFKRMGELNDE